MAIQRSLVLVCNSHIDPVWLWPWEEGLAATLATFRAAADLCEEFDDFVFCHNEALLYQWVEHYEPALFARLQRLVAGGRWHIMGGWYLQPDCNLPSGESLVRHVLVGKNYFLDRFGVEPTVAVNFDPFGHTRGLVQILAKAGYDGYLFCRPDATWLSLPSDDFRWVGYDGSTVLAHRAAEHYNSERGRARSKVERWLEAHAARQSGLLLWGVGNHGGGPSREDLHALADMSEGLSDRTISHGRPEDYFAGLRDSADSLPPHDGDLNPWAVGCYTSMATVKQAHARLERSLFAAEALSATASLQGLLPYPAAGLREALEDLLFCQFHDILPGEAVQEVEQQALARLGHGTEIVGRLRARAFFALLSGQPPALEGDYPIVALNHLPTPVHDTLAVEFQPPEPNFDRNVFWQPEIRDADGRVLPSQLEKESCNIQVDQRKRVVFRATLSPMSSTRFRCRLVAVARAAAPGVRPLEAPLIHRTRELDVDVDPQSGLLAGYRVGGVDYLLGPAPRPLVFQDTADPWGMKVRGFRELAGEFTLASPATAAAIAGIGRRELPPVRIVEDGPVRTVVEALFEYGRSTLCLRYKLPAEGTEIEIEAQVAWHEADRLLKLSFPTACAGGDVRCQVAFGVEQVRREAEEAVGHRWQALLTPDGRHALTLVNAATYGFDAAGGELRVSLLRAPAYAGHPVDEVTPIVRQDRFEPREDQGPHRFRFWLNAGPAASRLAAIDQESLLRPDGVTALCVFPPGGGSPALPGLILTDAAVRLAALKMSEDGTRLVVRLFETTGTGRRVVVRVPALDLSFDVALGGFELKTLAIDPASGSVTETDLLERNLPR